MMKKVCLSLCMILCMFTIVHAQQKLPIAVSKSTISWSCELSFYFSGHSGTVAFKEGHFIKTKDKITGGHFIIDMHSIAATDMEAEGNRNLTEHLKNADFFEVDTYPTATLEITKTNYIEPTLLQVEANLTIKGITNPIRFRANVDFEKKMMTTRFKIDRTLWGVTYNNKLKESAISDAIGFDVLIRL